MALKRPAEHNGADPRRCRQRRMRSASYGRCSAVEQRSGVAPPQSQTVSISASTVKDSFCSCKEDFAKRRSSSTESAVVSPRRRPPSPVGRAACALLPFVLCSLHSSARHEMDFLLEVPQPSQTLEDFLYTFAKTTPGPPPRRRTAETPHESPPLA